MKPPIILVLFIIVASGPNMIAHKSVNQALTEERLFQYRMQREGASCRSTRNSRWQAPPVHRIGPPQNDRTSGVSREKRRFPVDEDSNEVSLLH